LRCYAPLVPGLPPTTGSAVATVGTGTEPTDPVAVGSSEPADPSEAAALAIAERLLAELSAQSEPLSHRWARRLSSTPVKVALMLGGVVIVTGLLVGLMALLGLILPTGG
jgi:ferric-dicitrate binding protein FerR (iron transport regulator)